MHADARDTWESDRDDPNVRYTIEEQSEYSGNNVMECTGDPNEIECWIRQRVDSD